MQSNWNVHILLVGMENAAATWEKSLAVLFEVKRLSYNPETPFLGIYQQEMKVCS